MVKQGHVHIINCIRLKYCFALFCCRTYLGKWIEVVDIDTVVTDSGLRWLSVLPMLIGPRQAPSRPQQAPTRPVVLVVGWWWWTGIWARPHRGQVLQSNKGSRHCCLLHVISIMHAHTRNSSEIARSWSARMNSVSPSIVATMYC